VQNLPVDDLSASRLVDRSWNRSAAYVLRRQHRPISFKSGVEIKFFTYMMQHRIQPFPFSKFRFEILSSSIFVPVLAEFATKCGKYIEECEVGGAHQTDCSNFLGMFLPHTPKLRSLKADFSKILRFDDPLPLSFHLPNLNKLEVRLVSYDYPENCLLKKILDQSPSLKTFSMNIRGVCTDRQSLPNLLRGLPPGVKIGLKFKMQYSENSELLLQEFVNVPMQLFSLNIVCNRVMWDIFRTLLWNHSGTLLALILYDIPSKSLLIPNLPNCEFLYIDCKRHSTKPYFLTNISNLFQNLKKVKLRYTSYEILKIFVAKLPRLVELILVFVDWETLTDMEALTEDQVLGMADQLAGSFPLPASNPYAEMRRE